MKEPNENKAGYKKTKVGWIPVEWDDCRFESLWSRAPQNGLYKKGDNYGSGWRMVHMPDLFANDIISDQPMQLVCLTEKEQKNYVLKDGDLLFGRRSLTVEGAGKCSLVAEPCGELAFESSIIRLSPNRKALDPRYAYYYIASPIGRYQMYTFTRVVAVAGIAGSDLKLYRFPIPPLPEQEKIVEILSMWDEAISQTTKLIEAKQKLKKDLMQKLLTGKLRFSKFGKPAANGDLPKGWSRYCLSEIADVFYSGVDKKSFVDEIPVRLCNYLDVYNNEYISSRIDFMKATATDTEIEKFALKRGDVIITKDSETSEDIAKAATVIEDLPGVVCGYHLAILRPKPGVDGLYLGRLLMLTKVRYEFSRIANGVTRYGLNLSSVVKVPLWLPDPDEQKKIACLFWELDQWINSLVRFVIQLTEQKRGLMQKLLTGLVRVKV